MVPHGQKLPEGTCKASALPLFTELDVWVARGVLKGPRPSFTGQAKGAVWSRQVAGQYPACPSVLAQSPPLYCTAAGMLCSAPAPSATHGVSGHPARRPACRYLWAPPSLPRCSGGCVSSSVTVLCQCHFVHVPVGPGMALADGQRLSRSSLLCAARV